MEKLIRLQIPTGKVRKKKFLTSENISYNQSYKKQESRHTNFQQNQKARNIMVNTLQWVELIFEGDNEIFTLPTGLLLDTLGISKVMNVSLPNLNDMDFRS